jgi:hypothetical protein
MIDEPGNPLSKVCCILMLANGRVMVYEDISFFANKSLDKFRFRLVESPMVLNC